MVKGTIAEVFAGVFTGLSVLLIGLAAILILPLLGTLLGALVGEVADHIPYLNTAIPYVVDGWLGRHLLLGNLDKLGAFLGFASGFGISFGKKGK